MAEGERKYSVHFLQRREKNMAKMAGHSRAVNNGEMADTFRFFLISLSFIFFVSSLPVSSLSSLFLSPLLFLSHLLFILHLFFHPNLLIYICLKFIKLLPVPSLLFSLFSLSFSSYIPLLPSPSYFTVNETASFFLSFSLPHSSSFLFFLSLQVFQFLLLFFHPYLTCCIFFYNVWCSVFFLSSLYLFNNKQIVR